LSNVGAGIAETAPLLATGWMMEELEFEPLNVYRFSYSDNLPIRCVAKQSSFCMYTLGLFPGLKHSGRESYNQLHLVEGKIIPMQAITACRGIRQWSVFSFKPQQFYLRWTEGSTQ
jgi:hypothetical protein